MSVSFSYSAVEVARLMVGTDAFPGSGVNSAQTGMCWQLASKEFFEDLARRNNANRAGPVVLNLRLSDPAPPQQQKQNLTPKERQVEARRRPLNIKRASDDITIEFNAAANQMTDTKSSTRVFVMVEKKNPKMIYSVMLFKQGVGFLQLGVVSPSNITGGTIATPYGETAGFDRAWELVKTTRPPSTPPKQNQQRLGW